MCGNNFKDVFTFKSHGEDKLVSNSSYVEFKRQNAVANPKHQFLPGCWGHLSWRLSLRGWALQISLACLKLHHWELEPTLTTESNALMFITTHQNIEFTPQHAIQSLSDHFLEKDNLNTLTNNFSLYKTSPFSFWRGVFLL